MSTAVLDVTRTSRWGLPGVRVPGDARQPRPDVLLASGSLLLAGVEPGQRRTWLTWSEHLSRHGAPPTPDLATLAQLADAAGLRGYGGAAFPTAVKLRAMAGGRAPLVIVNGMEGEHASAKDGVLLRHVPHLVLDGALAAARALGAKGVTVRLAEDRPDLVDAVRAAAAERDATRTVTVSVGPAVFSAGEATAVINGVVGRPALPSPLGRPPLAPAGNRALAWVPGARRPALVSNVETFARLALVARGQAADSALLTLSGAVARCGVLELPAGSTLEDAVAAAGGLTEPVATAVTGGWHGRWVPWSAARGAVTVAGRAGRGRRPLGRRGIRASCRVAVPGHRAGRGGADPCRGQCRAVRSLSGRPAADRLGPLDLSDLSDRPAGASGRFAVDELRTSMESLRGRGLCAHPTAAVDALSSALDRVAEDLSAHAAGTCTATRGWQP